MNILGLPGLFTLCDDSETAVCFPRPTVRSGHLLSFVFPEGPLSSDGHCYCLPFPLTFSSCHCRSIYQFSIIGENVCLLNGGTALSFGGDALKVYFFSEHNPCSTSNECSTDYFISSYWISYRRKDYVLYENQHQRTLYYFALGSCRSHEVESLFSTSVGCIDQGAVKNYTVVFNESSLSTSLRINLTQVPITFQPQHLSWRYGSNDINFQDIKFHLGSLGELNIQQVKPTDAGCYTAIVSANGNSCARLHYRVYVECELYLLVCVVAEICIFAQF